MLPERTEILRRLPVFANDMQVISNDQSVNDIMQAMQKFHKKYAKQYDLIAEMFIGRSAADTCKNLFSFLKQSCYYHIESKAAQSVRSPAAIVATGDVIGIDCKNYALFIGGVLDAINRSGVDHIPFIYRYASYDAFDRTPAHVFVVAYPGTKNELWIDPVLDRFNGRYPSPNFIVDKNFSTMLYGLSGVNDNNAAVGSGILADTLAAPKRYEELMSRMDELAPAFLYLYLDHWAPYMNKINPVIKEKQAKAFQTAFDFGAQTKRKSETDILPKLREAVTRYLGESPESFWSRVLKTNVTRAHIAGTDANAFVLDTVNKTVPGAGAVTSILSSLFPGLHFKFPLESFRPDPADWTGYPYNPFKENAAEEIADAGGAMVKKAGAVNPLLLIGLGGAALLYFANKKRR